MEELLNHIFGSLNSSEKAIKRLRAANAKQNSINKSIVAFSCAVAFYVVVVTDHENRIRDKKIAALNAEIEELKHLEEAGLLEWQGAKMVVPIKGRLLARRVAMTFDRHLRESQAKGTYSKVL